MAGAEERGGAARGRARRAGDHHGFPYLGIAAAVIVLARAPQGLAQMPSTGTPPSAAAGGAEGGGTPGATTPQPGTTGGTPEPGAAPGAPAAGAAASRGPAWTIIPSVSVNEAFTDNVFSTATQRRSDLISTLAPGLFVTGASPRLQGVFNYSPQVIKYLDNTSQDQIQQNLFSNGTLTAVPDFLFVDGSASISDQSRTGGRGFNNAAPLPTAQSTQTIAYTGSPYLRFRVGDDGDAELRYTLSQTVFSGNTGSVIDPLTGQNLGSISNSTQHAGTFTYNTGDAFSRLQFGFLSSYIQFISGNGALNSRHAVDTLTGAYAVTDQVSALFGGGYEKLAYPHQPQSDFAGPNWSLGARYQPRADRQITLTYGEVEGQNTFAGSMLYALTGDATLSAAYSEQNSSAQQQILQNLANSTQLSPGLTINPTTGLPQAITNPNLALQNNIFRARNLQAGLTVERRRNHYSASFNRTEDTSLGAGGLDQTTTGGVLSWSRDLTPNATGIMSAGYASTASTAASGAAAASTDALTFGVSVNVALSETLSAGANYALSRQTGGISAPILVDIVSVSLRKTF